MPKVNKIVCGIKRVGQAEQTKFRLSDFEKIEKIGEGTFGKVYKAEYRDLTTGHKRIYALKKVKMLNLTKVEQ